MGLGVLRGGVLMRRALSRPQPWSCWWPRPSQPGPRRRVRISSSRRQGLRGVHLERVPVRRLAGLRVRVQQHGGRAARRGEPARPGRDHRRVAAGSLARWRRPRPDLVDVLERRDELVEARRRALERLPGRPSGSGASPTLGLLRQGRQSVLHRPADRLRSARHLGDLGDELERDDLEGATDPDRGSGGPVHLERQGLDHR